MTDDRIEPAADDDLYDAAVRARAAAYVPYSQFAMGAAVRTRSGTLIGGAVVENVSLGLAMCAERVALFGAALAEETPVELALVAARTAGQLTWPCGACLQVGLELGGPTLIVRVRDLDGNHASAQLGDLLPNGPHSPASRGADQASGAVSRGA